MLKISSLLIILLIVNYIYAQTSIVVPVSIFDQHPWWNNNFEPHYGDLCPGLVTKTLDPITKVPALNTLDPTNATNVAGRMNSPQLFQYFFAPGVDSTTAQGRNVFLNYNLTLTQNPSTSFYEYFNDYFFPINYKGWDTNATYRIYNDGKNYQNFHFCLKMNTYFTYKLTDPPMTFNFIGDDDVYVYINNQLAVDLGGLHNKESGSVTFNSTRAASLGIYSEGVYPFDFFYCERHTTESHMGFQVSFNFSCAYIDYCHVCNGGGECCQPSQCVSPPVAGSKCYTAACPPPTAPISMNNISANCIYTPITYSELTNKCYTASCDKTTGLPILTPNQCASLPCQSSVCNNATGCSYTPTCVASDICQTATCNSNGACSKAQVSCPGQEPNCYAYTCNPSAGGCVKTPTFSTIVYKNDGVTVDICQTRQCINNVVTTVTTKDCTCTNAPNKCQIIDTCNTTTLLYTFKPLPEIDDGNPCTNDSCDTTTGAIQHTPIQCSGCTICNQTLGLYACSAITGSCDDSNLCTLDSCNLSNSSCTFTPLVCPIPTNKCLQSACDNVHGCVNTNITCPEPASACQEAYCDPVNGCGVRDKNCTSQFYCKQGFCDPRLGCLTIDRECVADKPNCQYGVCSNETASCSYHNRDPLPFACNTAKVVSTAVIAGVAVAGAVALGIALFGGKKGYDYWKEHRGDRVTMANANPLYEQKPGGGGDNPLYTNTNV